MRITISDIGNHPWTTNNGKEPLPPLPSLQEQVEEVKQENKIIPRFPSINRIE